MQYNPLSLIARFIIESWHYHITANLTNIPPRCLLLALTYKCNSKCKMCNIWKRSNQQELQRKDWKKMLNDPIFRKISNLDLTGGEVFLLHNLVDLVALFVKYIPSLRSMSIVSNGLCTDSIVSKTKQIAAICHKRNISLTVSISLDATDSQHDIIRGISGAFEKTSTTLLALKSLERDYHFKVFSGSMVLRDNLANTERMRAWFQKHKIPFTYQIVGFNSSHVKNLDCQDQIDFRPQDIELLSEFLLSQASKKGLLRYRSYYWRDLLAMYKDHRPRTTPCPFLKDHFAIDADGSVYYCLHQKIGKWTPTVSLSTIYYNKKNLGQRNSLWKSKCAYCTSACSVESAIRRNFLRYLWYKLTSRPWYGPIRKRQAKDIDGC